MWRPSSTCPPHFVFGHRRSEDRSALDCFESEFVLTSISWSGGMVGARSSGNITTWILAFPQLLARIVRWHRRSGHHQRGSDSSSGRWLGPPPLFFITSPPRLDCSGRRHIITSPPGCCGAQRRESRIPFLRRPATTLTLLPVSSASDTAARQRRPETVAIIGWLLNGGRARHMTTWDRCNLPGLGTNIRPPNPPIILACNFALAMGPCPAGRRIVKTMPRVSPASRRSLECAENAARHHITSVGEKPSAQSPDFHHPTRSPGAILGVGTMSTRAICPLIWGHRNVTPPP